MDEKNNPRSLAMLSLSMFIFGTVGIFRRAIPLPSVWIAFFRGVIGCLFLLLLMGLRRKKSENNAFRAEEKTKKRPVSTFLLLALTGALIGLNWLLLFEAYTYSSVPVATLCYYMEPVFVLLASALLFRERLGPKQLACAFCAFLGMVFVSGVAETGLPGPTERKGMLLALAAAALYAAVVLLNRSECAARTDPYEKTVVQLAAAALVLLPFLFRGGNLFSQAQWDPSAAGLLLLIGVIHTGISYALYFASMKGLRTQTVALFSYIDPVTALAASALLLHERLGSLGLLGAGLILGAAIAGETEIIRKDRKK